MFFLLRTAFWLTLVLVLIPIGSGEDTSTDENINPAEAYFAAQATISDFSGFCQRNPDACQTGSEALTAIGSRARDGARIVYEYLDTKIADEEIPDAIVTGSTDLVTTSATSPAPLPPYKPNSDGRI